MFAKVIWTLNLQNGNYLIKQYDIAFTKERKMKVLMQNNARVGHYLKSKGEIGFLRK